MPAQPRIIFAPTPGKPLTEQDIAAIIGRLSRSDEQWNALYQLLQRRLYGAVIDGATARLTEREAGHAAGRVSELTDLMAQLASYLDAEIKRK
jgi:hypothetical protein